MATTAFPAASVSTDATSVGSRRAPWRSPADQPAYARPALLLVAAFAAVLYTWGIDQSQYHTFYSDAVRSMTENWKAFFFGSFDPGNTITLDKLPGFLWPQALSARIFGFHAWALTLPQVIEGVLSVLVLYRVVRRWAGANAALIAAAAFTLTPVAAGLFRSAVEDAAFTLLLLLAADATQRAAQSARLRPLVLAGVWVGLAFQTKMLEAWAVLPALGLVYLVSAPTALRRRLIHLAIAGAVMVAVSASWIVIVTLTPAKDRPYVDGTTNNSALSMVVGYNFLNRFSALGISAADTGSVSATQGGGGAAGHAASGRAGRAGAGAGAGQPGGYGGSYGGSGSYGGASGGAYGGSAAGGGRSATAGSSGGQPGGFDSAGGGAGGGRGVGGARGGARVGGVGGAGAMGGENGWGKMFGASLASQTGWLYPVAALAAVLGLVWRRRRSRTDVLRAGYLLWAVWLATYFLVFSAGSVTGHTYYMGVVAVPLAALTGAGVTHFWRAYREGGRRAWALPAAVAATAGWGAVVAWDYPSFLPWLGPLALGLGVVALVLLALGRPGGRAGNGRRLAVVGLLAGLAAMLVGPAAWASSVFDSAYGHSTMGTVGPASGFGFGGGGAGGRSALAGGRVGGTGGGARWAGAAGGAAAAGRTGLAAGGGMAALMGGGSTLTAQQQALLSYTEAHRDGATYLFATTSWSTASPYIMADGADVLPMGGFTGEVPSPTLAQVQQDVTAGKLHYLLLSGSGGAGGFAGFGGFGGGGGASTPSTAVANWVRSACSVVPAQSYGGTTGSGASASAQQLYHCAAG